MSNIIPPLLSSSPPPVFGVLDEEEEDEFGNFADATNLSYGCDALSVSSLPQKSPKKDMNQSILNCCHNVEPTSTEMADVSASERAEKDFQDKRNFSTMTSCDSEKLPSDSESNGQENHTEGSINSMLCNSNKIRPQIDNKYNTFQYIPEIPPDLVPENDEDEFESIGNGYSEEFEEFQDFESCTNITNSGVLNNKFFTSNETDIPEINCSADSNLDHSRKFAEATVSHGKIVEKDSEHENKFTKHDKDLDVHAESTQVKVNSLETKKFKITSCPMNVEVSALTSSRSNSPNLTDADMQDSSSHEISVAVQPSAQTFKQRSFSDENISLKNEDENTSIDIVISDFRNVKIQAELAVEESNKGRCLENEDDFSDLENYSSKPNVQDTVAKSVEQDHVAFEHTFTLEEDIPVLLEDKFGNFETPLSETNLDWASDPFRNTTSVYYDVDDFGDFDNQVFEEPSQLNKVQDSFAAFGDFSNADEAQINPASKLKTSDDDDFGDFNDYSGQAQTFQQDLEEAEDTQQLHGLLSMDVEVVRQRAQAVVVQMFPVFKHSTENYCEQDFTSGDDSVFRALKDVTDTCALLYQWGKSSGQNCLLRALNIDTRNILYGPRWNESMPRYAATLGFTPLEPVKSETLASTSSEPSAVAAVPSSQTPSSESAQQTDIPSAQFDWVGSGLTNPLENSPASTMLLDLEQLVASLDIQFFSTLTPKSPNSPSPVNDIDDWEFWLRLTPEKVIEKCDLPLKESKTVAQSILQTDVTKTPHEIDTKPTDFEFSCVLQPVEGNTVLQSHSDSGSVKSLQLNEIQPEEVVNKVESSITEFDDFTSFQSSSQSEESTNFSGWSFNAVPLRETHISNSQSGSFVKRPGKTWPNCDEPGWLKPTILTPDLPRKVSVVEGPRQEEDEFTDFQTSEPSVNCRNVPIKSVIRNVELETKFDSCYNANSDGDDDEFADFQSTLPDSFNVIAKPTLLPQEPLQPAILEPPKLSVLQPAINWPDPGITDDDLICIEVHYKPKSLNNEPKTPLQINSDKKSESCNVSASKQIDQEPSRSADDDDWSDFVSNQGPPTVTAHNIQPSFKTTSQVKQSSRTSTPELSLSVPQLNQIQPPRRPVPVITQQGLVETKLAVELPVQPSVQPTKTYPHVGQLQNGFQPSLISNQFAAQFGQGLGYRSNHQNKPLHNINEPKPAKAVHNVQQDIYNISKTSQHLLTSHTSKPLPQPVLSSKTEEFDDEWTDFVSSQPAPSIVSSTVLSNGLCGNPQPKLNFDWNRPPQFTSWSTNMTPNIITNPVSFDSFQSYSSPSQTDLLKNRTENRKSPSVVVQPKKNLIPSISSVPDLEFIAPKSRTWKK